MLFWIICSLLTLGVAGLVAAPLLRPPRLATENPDIGIYKAQLAEIDRDIERGTLSQGEAEQTRTEIARRLLAANKADQTQATTSKGGKWTLITVFAVMPALVFTVYIGPAGIARHIGVSEERIAELKDSIALPIHFVLPRRVTRNFDDEINLPLFFEGIGAPGYADLPLKQRIAQGDEMRANRPSQSALEAVAPAQLPVNVPDEYREAIDQLREIAPTRPGDIEAWSRLAFHEAELRNYTAAKRAQEQVIAIKGDNVTIEDQRLLLDMMVVAAGGIVSPEAERIIRLILTEDEDNIAARYYYGVLYYQTDRPDIAFRAWRELADNGDPQNFHVASARAQIETAAFRAGIDYTLPVERGPSAADLEAAQDMTPEERNEMISGMVASLSDRLANQGGTARDWARLITAYGVLGDTASAQSIWTEAQDVFGADPEAVDILTEAAEQAGLNP